MNRFHGWSKNPDSLLRWHPVPVILRASVMLTAHLYQGSVMGHGHGGVREKTYPTCFEYQCQKGYYDSRCRGLASEYPTLRCVKGTSLIGHFNKACKSRGINDFDEWVAKNSATDSYSNFIIGPFF